MTCHRSVLTGNSGEITATLNQLVTEITQIHRNKEKMHIHAYITNTIVRETNAFLK